MAKSKDLTAQEIKEGYDKLPFEERLSICIHSNQDMANEKKKKGEDLEKLAALENKGK